MDDAESVDRSEAVRDSCGETGRIGYRQCTGLDQAVE